MALRRTPKPMDQDGDFGFMRPGPDREEGPPLRSVDDYRDKGAVDPGIIMPPNPDIPKSDASRLGESARERDALRQSGAGGAGATPVRPRTPQPMAGSTMSPGTAPTGPIPFQPMGGPSPTSLTSSRRGSMYGSLGGLQGGGFGVPLDPTSNQASDPISSLIAQLLKQRG